MSDLPIAPLQGMSDICAPEVFFWHQVEDAARRVFDRYGFTEVRTPVIERLEVFVRTLGEQTDVVKKEMYAFEDRGGRRVALRPEGTAGVIRHLAGAGPAAADARVYYIGPMFRCERPQAGRKRQFHQVGVEALGAPVPAADAECIALQMDVLREIGLDGGALRVNTRGDAGDQDAVARSVRDALATRRGELCADCVRRIDENVLRVLDCKQAGCRAVVQTLPPVASAMSAESRAYLADVLRLLRRLNIDVIEDTMLVRGLDYYRHTIWEITHPALGAQDSIAGGGRYGIQLGNRILEGVGFAMGIERLVMALEASGVATADSMAPRRVWIVSAGDAVREENLVLAQTLRAHGIPCSLDLAGRSVKAQMRAANRANARRVVVRGEAEMERGIFLLKDMQDGSQDELALPELIERLLRPA